MKIKSVLFPAIAAVFLLGCEANGVDAGNFPGGSNVPPGSVADITNCATPVSGLCVLGGDSHPGGLVDVLLAPDGPLGPIAGAIDTDALVEALTFTLQNDDGDLASIVQGLVADGQLQDGLTLLLLGEDGDGMGALAETLTNLLLPNEAGQGLESLISVDGGVGLVQALVFGGNEANCQAPLGTLCLISGDGNQAGLLDLLLTSPGLAGGLSPTLTQEATDELVATLGDLAESNGALADLVTGLFQEGQLAEGLQVLLQGQGGISGVADLVDGSIGNLDQVLDEVLGSLVGGLGAGALTDLGILGDALGGAGGDAGLVALLGTLGDLGAAGEPVGGDELEGLLGGFGDLGELLALADLLGGLEDGGTGGLGDLLDGLLGGLLGGGAGDIGDLAGLLGALTPAQ